MMSEVVWSCGCWLDNRTQALECCGKPGHLGLILEHMGKEIIDMPSNPHRYDDRDLPSGKTPPSTPDLSDPSRSHAPNSPDREGLHTGEDAIRRHDQFRNG